MSLSAESSSSGTAADSGSNLASNTSTPATTVSDSASQLSDASHQDVITVAHDAANAPPPSADVAPPSSPALRRPRRPRVSAPVYNLSKLSGTDGHGKRRAKGDIVADRRRRTVSSDTLVASIEVATEAQPNPTSRNKGAALRAGIESLDLPWSLNKISTPRTRLQARECSDSRPSIFSSLGSKLSSMGKRSRGAPNKGQVRMSRELRRLQDTNEFSGIDDRPVYHTVWSNGKYVDPNEPALPRASKKAKLELASASGSGNLSKEKDESEPITNPKKRRGMRLLDKGLYAGQDAPLDPFKGLTVAEKKQLSQLPEWSSGSHLNRAMPLPIFAGLRLLITGRDFKLPYHVCNPLPPGQPKPDEWKKMTKNRFIGDSKDYWRKLPHLNDYQSKCVCKPEDGCGESCQNRIMLYECDETNCNIGKGLCTNRAFADLSARRARGGKYRVGVEVIKTPDRGYGVRSNRCFRPNQIIMEYAGEIITEEECERRMNEVYKDNECYYLMSFDQNMIIDATTGSIARFVNHSCNPNCRMIKWIVSGQPRMALFAGDKPIMTGDELTYDYNFDPFSAKNVQACLCGEANCRGVLGPKPREVKPPKTDLRNVVKATVKAGKRKMKELLGDDEVENCKVKKRKLQQATSAKLLHHGASLRAAKGAANAIRKGVSTATINAKKAVRNRGTSLKKRAGSRVPLSKSTSSKRLVKKYGRTGRAKMPSSRSSSLTIVARGGDEDVITVGKSPRYGNVSSKHLSNGRKMSGVSAAPKRMRSTI